MPSGIATTYNGIEFRSRLEAKWAFFFDMLGWRYEYEPFDLDYYIPDFLLVGTNPVLVEVKPYATLSEFGPLAANLPMSPYPFLLVGTTPFNDGGNSSCPAIGLTSEYAPGWVRVHGHDASDDPWFDTATFSHCWSCGSFYFVHDLGSWIPRGVQNPCKHCRKPGMSYESEARARGYWAQAQNITKWAA